MDVVSSLLYCRLKLLYLVSASTSVSSLCMSSSPLSAERGTAEAQYLSHSSRSFGLGAKETVICFVLRLPPGWRVSETPSRAAGSAERAKLMTSRRSKRPVRVRL